MQFLLDETGTSQEYDECDDQCRDVDDEGQTDVSDDESENEMDESTTEENDEHNPGDIVWAQHGRIWYPAQVVTSGDLPPQLQKQFSTLKEKVIVKWFGENNFSYLNPKQIDSLGKNLVDASRAAKSKYMKLF